ncbi:sterol carrier family protein [Streptomyces abyssomicinicus]|uniref:sterol carrier family protein n=1 Tax=Streptomyces abyssomicinicus TaxID=574929 RepID=UPI00124FD392|nr:sterol carrier family protein [Streptomyces abyssomicinicus]
MAPGNRKKPRTYDALRTRTAVLAQFASVRRTVGSLTPDQLAAPTRLGEWTVRDLAVHIALATGSTSRLLDAPEPAKAELVPATWAATSARHAARIAASVRESAEAHPDLDALYADTADRLAADLAANPGRRVLAGPTGALTLTDHLATRCVELAVHTDDLNAALAAVDGPVTPQDRQALAAATRVLADALAHTAPGGSTEVRVPPFAVVQCVEGLRHTRGTPPNVVETDPLTWLRLATGRLTWAQAREAAAVSASGERADLSPWLPLMG